MNDLRLNPFKKICVFGIGGVGGYFGGKLAYNSKEEQGVYFIARGEHLRMIQEKGLLLNAQDTELVCKPTLATDNVEEIPSPDLILLCTKSYDLENAVKQLIPKIQDHTIILPLLNGVDIYERIRKVTSKGIVLPACVYILAHIEKPGKVIQKGPYANILSGFEPGQTNFNPENLIQFFADNDIRFKWYDDPQPAIWEKYLFIASFGMVTAYSGGTFSQVMSNANLQSMVRNIMDEIVRIAIAKKVVLPENIVEISINRAVNIPPDSTTSYQRDIELKGKLNEGDIYGETIIRMGKETGVQTPVVSFLYDKILNKLNKL